jgi:hypothetical protein
VHARWIQPSQFEQPLSLCVGEADDGIGASYRRGQKRMLRTRGALEAFAKIEIEENGSQSGAHPRDQGDERSNRCADDVGVADLPGETEFAGVPGEAGQWTRARLQSLEERLDDRRIDAVVGQMILAEE